jgi:hypothetical protein
MADNLLIGEQSEVAEFGCLSPSLRNTLPRMERRFRRFTKATPCPICGGHSALGRGQGIRCFGYFDGSGRYARCTREENAGGLSQNRDGTYSHRLDGDCPCDQAHEHVASAGRKPRRTGGTSNQRFRSYFTLKAFLRRYYGEGAKIRYWAYHDRDACEVFRVVRVDYQTPDGMRAKTYRPCFRDSDQRWRLSGPGGLLPLYRLPTIHATPADTTLVIVEGEKCADLTATIGLPQVTTSAHGAQSPWLTDWSPLAGRVMAIMPDEGAPGADYAGKVAVILAGLSPPARIRMVRLPGLADGDDIEQWIAGRRSSGKSDADILAELRTLIDQADELPCRAEDAKVNEPADRHRVAHGDRP